MSYKSLVLSDSPSLFYLMDDTSSTISDLSAFNLDASFSGTRDNELMPLVAGCARSTKISGSNYATYPELTDIGTIGNDYNAFSIEFWFKPSGLSSAPLVSLVADAAENIGVFFDKTSIVFSVDHSSIRHHLPIVDKVIHVVAVYSINSIELYVDGVMVSTAPVNAEKFTASSIIFKSEASSGSFLINSIALYKYSVGGNRAYSHYVYGNTLPSLHVVSPNNGHLFEIFDNGISKQYSFSYPGNKDFSYFAGQGLVYDDLKRSIRIPVGAGDPQEFSFTDIISIPSGVTIDDSYIEWDGGSLVKVETSIDDDVYTECTNGRSIPQYIIESDNFATERLLYIRVTLSTSDDSKYNPEITYLTIRFYNQQRIYATNYPSYITRLEASVDVNAYEVDLGSRLYPVLSRSDLNGIKTVQDSGFNLITDMSTNTVELFYTPYALTDSGLVSSLADSPYSASNYSWRSDGTISKTNIEAMYVNGINKTSATQISSVFKAGELHHIVLVFSSPISNTIKFNHSQYGSVPALYQNIATYEDQFTEEQAIENYNIYTGNSVVVVEDATVSLTENPVKAYNNDWIVIQNV